MIETLLRVRFRNRITRGRRASQSRGRRRVVRVFIFTPTTIPSRCENRNGRRQRQRYDIRECVIDKRTRNDGAVTPKTRVYFKCAVEILKTKSDPSLFEFRTVRPAEREGYVI